MGYQAVLFDMDGTVLDTLEDLYRAVNRSLEEFSLPVVSRERVRAGLGNGAAHLIDFCVPEDCPEARRQQVLDWYKPWYDAHCRIATRPYPGILPLMERLRDRGVKLAIISNKPDPAVRELAEAFFPGLLEAAVGEGETVRRKPDPSAVLTAARRMGVEIGKCVYVGDSEVDYATAQSCGSDLVLCSWGFRGRKELEELGAKTIVDTPEELIALLEREDLARRICE